MLKALKSGERQSSLIYIEDAFQCSGIQLLKSLLLSVRSDTVHLLLFEKSQQKFMKNFVHSIANLHVHDFTSDPLAWAKNSDALRTDSSNLYELITRSSAGSYTVVIDSLSQLILQRSTSYTCNVLHRLATDKEGGRRGQVIALCHRDVHDDSVLSNVRHMAQTVIALRPSPAADADAACSIIHRRQHGKVLFMEEEFALTDSCQLSMSREISSLAPPAVVAKQVDPGENLTFRVNLTEQEKVARSQVKLPYIFDKDKKEVLLQQSGREPEIFYEPDERDDFDAEDPDEDLNI